MFFNYFLRTNELSPIKTIFTGGMAGIINWMVALPADVVKSIVQTAPEGKYKSLLQVYAELIKADGIGAFFKGFTPVIIRAFPSNSV